MVTLLTALIFILGIGFIAKKIAMEKGYDVKLDEENGFRFLLGWMLFGFLTGFDHSTAFGCVIGLESFLDVKSIVFSLGVLALILWAYKTENQKLKRILCISELLYWIFKLIVFKGGYAVGFAGGADGIIVMYDLVAILARLFIISQLLSIATLEMFRGTIIIMISCFIIGLKIAYFSIPPSTLYEIQKGREEAEETRKALIGYWKGTIKKLEDGNVVFEKVTQIRIGEKYMFFEHIKGLGSRYKFNLDYLNTGSISNELNTYDVTINKLEEDSLVIALENLYVKKYELRLKQD